MAAFTSELSRHAVVNSRRFHSLCPNKFHYRALLNSGAIPQWSVHVYSILASTRLTESCAERVRSTHQPLPTRVVLGQLLSGWAYSVIFKLLFFSSSSCLCFFKFPVVLPVCKRCCFVLVYIFSHG